MTQQFHLADPSGIAKKHVSDLWILFSWKTLPNFSLAWIPRDCSGIDRATEQKTKRHILEYS